MKNILLADYRKQEYIIPESQEERFLFLTDKILYAKENGYEELYRGLVVIFNAEFNKMKG